MWKVNEAVIIKNQQIAGLKVLIFEFHYMMMYFTDNNFPSKKLVTTQVLVFSRFRKQAPKSTS